MTDKQIIEKAMGFLCSDYGFMYDYESVNNGAEYYRFFNKYGCFTYYQWEQFQEKEFSVKYDMSFRVIEFQYLFPDEYKTFKQTHKGIKWWFKDKRLDYWNMFAKLIKEEIEKKGSLFGLRICEKVTD